MTDYPDDLGILRDAAGLSARCAELRDRLVAQGKRAEKAEAELAEAQMQFRTMSAEAESAIREWKAKLAEAQGRIALWERALPNTAEHVAEVERLREALRRRHAHEGYTSGPVSDCDACAALRGGGE